MSDYLDSHLAERAGKILVVSTVILSVLVIVVYFIHLYAKWFLYRREDNPNNRSSSSSSIRRRQQDLAAEQQSGVTVLRRGLDPSFLKTLPLIPFDPKHFKQGLECAVCLSDVAQGEKARILPNCNHGFHVECIDMWFYSHSTCPICRNPVSAHAQVSVENLLESRQTQQQPPTTDPQHLPTNILFWGDETQVSTLTSQLQEASSYHETPVLTSSSSSSSSSQTNTARPDLVIDIPTQNDCDCDEDKKSPVSSRMRSLRRILSSGSRYINPFSPATSNNEQGTRGAYF